MFIDFELENSVHFEKGLDFSEQQSRLWCHLDHHAVLAEEGLTLLLPATSAGGPV